MIDFKSEGSSLLRGMTAIAAWLVLALDICAANFVEPSAIDCAALIGPPPAGESVAGRAELEVVLQLQALRTPEMERRAREIDRESVFSFGAEVVGPWFTADRLPKTAAFFARVRADFIPVNRTAKDLWPRRRPPFVDARVQPCLETTDSGSYPSGHAIQSSLWATLLAALMPEHAAGFEARAEETRRSRLIAGVHFPSDMVAGQVVGKALGHEMLKSPALREEMRAVGAELMGARTAR